MLVKELNLIIHQPTMLDIAYLGEEKLSLSTSILNVGKDKIDLDGLDEETREAVQDIDVLYMFLSEKENRNAMSALFSIIFKEYEHEFVEQNVIHLFKTVGEIRVLDLYIGQEELEILREYINEVLMISFVEPEDDDDYNPEDGLAAEIAEKMRQGRKKIAEMESKKAKETTKDGIANLVSALAVGLQLPLDSIMSYTLYQLYDQSARFGKFESSQIAIELMKMGGDADAVNWREDLEIRK